MTGDCRTKGHRLRIHSRTKMRRNVFAKRMDTIIALEASSRYYFAFLKREEEINMKIQFHGFGSPIENTIHLRRHNALTEKELKILMSVTGKPPLLEDEKPYPIEAAQASAMTVETTAYALLQALSRNDIDYATRIARWPTMQQNYGGGFHSTQKCNVQIQFLGFGSPIENTIHLRRQNALTEKELKDHAECCYPDSSFISVHVYSWANVLVWSQELRRSRLWDSCFLALCCRTYPGRESPENCQSCPQTVNRSEGKLGAIENPCEQLAETGGKGVGETLRTAESSG
ncbi:uncharacterized protein LOC132207614 [Stegostoma tigrinum]|uniref:uncharacterized protein LOC132207614 n=1 Tax=Stegostoma tigrinum TaxID=3053191 RepID=UPI0028703489|nr:uncharacterized protein LOC132207614 [Stegostoma tigrinum]